MPPLRAQPRSPGRSHDGWGGPGRLRDEAPPGGPRPTAVPKDPAASQAFGPHAVGAPSGSARPLSGRSGLAGALAAYGRQSAQALAETLWPTRCAVCDAPGEPLCASCRLKLAFLDWWRACPRCGAPYGRVQCSECNTVVLAASGRSEPPFDACASALVYDDAAARIVRTWKDGGERRLFQDMAGLMAPAACPWWLAERPAVVAIPATAAALARRGFDHGRELSERCARLLGLETSQLLARPRAKDQRKLARRSRLQNMEGRFRTLPGARAPGAVLVIDDVYTTGATFFAAADALRGAGARSVFCLSFARVW